MVDAGFLTLFFAFVEKYSSFLCTDFLLGLWEIKGDIVREKIWDPFCDFEFEVQIILIMKRVVFHGYQRD